MRMSILVPSLLASAMVVVGIATTSSPSVFAEQSVAEPLQVAVVTFPGVELLDFAGPAEVFAGAKDEGGINFLEVYTVAASTKPLKSMRFLTITPQYDATQAPAPDIVVVPGGNVEAVMNQPDLLEWLESNGLPGQSCSRYAIAHRSSPS